MDDNSTPFRTTIELMDCDEADVYDGVTTGVGGATALGHMVESDIQLLI